MRRYRTRLVRKNLNQIEYGHITTPLTILESINYLDEAWEEICVEIIQNCYRKAGFKTSHDILPEPIDAYDSAYR